MTETTPELSINQRVAREVRAWVARRQLTQADAAMLIGVSQQGMSRRMSGATPFALDELEVLATAFGIRLTVLLGEPPTVTELRTSGPLGTPPHGPGVRARRGRKLAGEQPTTPKVNVACGLRDRSVTAGYARANLGRSGQSAHNRRAA